MAERKNPKELWRGWTMLYYYEPTKVWLPAAHYPTRAECTRQAHTYAAQNSLKTKVKRAKLIAF